MDVNDLNADELIPPPQSQEEYRTLVALVSSISEFPRMSHQEQDILMRHLEAYECYRQLDQLLRWRIARPDRSHSQKLNDSIWLMKVFYLGLDSFDSFLDAAELCVKSLQIPFSTIRLRILDEVLGHESFKEHVEVLRVVIPLMQDVPQRVLALERLAVIAEKKLFLEGEVDSIYSQILKLAPHNEKARKHRKILHIHNMEWTEAAAQLKVLAEHTGNLQERARHKHELAQLYLYNLNQPGAALEILRPMAIQFPETRHTLIEAYERLEMNDELISALVSFERTSRDPEESSQFKFRRGNGLLKLGRPEEAAKAFREALQLNPNSLLVHESLVAALLEIGSTVQLREQLMNLRDVVQLEGSRKSLEDLLSRAQRIIDLQVQTGKL